MKNTKNKFTKAQIQARKELEDNLYEEMQGVPDNFMGTDGALDQAKKTSKIVSRLISYLIINKVIDPDDVARIAIGR